MLAIVVPFYKLTFFDETLMSLANQTDKRFKVYICDDASPENPVDLLKKNQGKFDFIYHRFEENLGGISLTKQWERCIALSGNEEWMMILGDDDVLGDNVVEEFYKNLPEIRDVNSNLVKFSLQNINAVTDIISKVYQNDKLENATDFYFGRYLGQKRSSLSEHIFKKEIYLKYGFKNYPLAWHSDDYAWIEFAEHNPIYSINMAIVQVRVSNESLSGSMTNFEKKNEAELLFFLDLVKNKLHLFKKSERLKLFYQLEVSIKKSRELYVNEWIILFIKYISNFSIVSFSKFIRRIVISSIR